MNEKMCNEMNNTLNKVNLTISEYIHKDDFQINDNK